MNDPILQLRRFVAESFILFSLFALGLLVYLHMRPYAYPGLVSRIIWVFLYYLILLFVLYHMEILSFLVKTIDIVLAKVSRTGLPIGEKAELLTKRISTYIDNDYSKYTEVEFMVRGVNFSFQILLIIFLLTLLIRELSPSMVNWINMNYLLILVIIFGAAAVLANKENDKQNVEPVTITKRDYIFIGIAGVAGAIIVWYKVQSIGSISYLIALLSGMLIIMLSIIIMEEDETDQLANITNDMNNEK